jgi:uncharacterized protein YeaO (DUF488 family)
MIKVKHLMDDIEADDGQRISVEPFGLTRDLREWCRVDHVLPHLGPSRELFEWLEEHPDGYDYFRGEYHELLTRSPYLPALRHLAASGQQENFTLLHQGNDPNENSAAALHEFLSELRAWSSTEEA